jgi:PEP-CTERM motif
MAKRVFLAALLVWASSASSRAATLVVMAVNTNPGVAGARTFTIGVRIYQSDLLRPGVGAHPTLTIHDFGFLAGNSSGPVQFANVPDLQTAWNTLDANSPNSIANGDAGGPSFPAPSGPPTNELYRDSWWYSSPTGTLQGINGFAPDQSTDFFGTVSTVNSGQGVYAQGPGALVGTTGNLWSPVDTGITGGASSGAAVGFSGVFGPNGGIDLTSPDITSQFNSGTLTIPLMQVVAKGFLGATSNYDQGQYISIGGANFNFAGGDESTNADHLIGGLNFQSPSNLFITPEPGTLTLAAFGAVAAIFAWRRGKRSVR